MPTDKTPRFRWKKEYTELLDYSTVGIEMGVAVGIGVGIGWWLDHKVFDGRTSPWLTMLFLALGLTAGARAFYRAAKEMREKTRDKKEDLPRQ